MKPSVRVRATYGVGRGSVVEKVQGRGVSRVLGEQVLAMESVGLRLQMTH